MNEGDNLAFAENALSKLEEMHRTFMQHVSSLVTKSLNGAEIRVRDGELSATCLGVSLSAQHRPIARDGQLDAIEYAFFTRHCDQDLRIWSIYLEQNNDLYADPKKETKVCSSRNEYLATYLLDQLASTLLRSQVFVPYSEQSTPTR